MTPMNSGTEKKSGLLGPALLLAALVVVITASSSLYLLMEGSSGGEEVAIIIPRGASITRVAELLAEGGVIQRPAVFRILMRITGGAHKVRAGEFRFQTHMRPLDALHRIYYEDPIVHTITVPEGWNLYNIAEAVSEKGLGSKERVIELAHSKPLLSKYGISTTSLEGFLYPDTYAFSVIDGEDRILETMVKRFFTKFTEAHRKKAESMGFSLTQIVTLASIIEKETGVAEERTTISSVFHNRLKKKMRLQSDPTTIYGIRNFDGNLTKADLQRMTPYNTYRISGLPPGPIANPGIDALVAALEPIPSSYLYFVANNQGAHLFSETYQQHQRYVNMFQKILGRSPTRK